MQNENSDPHAMLLWQMIRGGRVPLSFFNTWMTAKIMARALDNARRPIMIPLDQGYFAPAHWRARRRQTMDGMRQAVPGKSNFASFSRNV
jgi:hypothetical protein